MPHYRDGTEAKVGDRVRGTGYNAGSHGYDPGKGVEGIVTEVRPGLDTAGGCTLSVSFLRAAPPGYYGMTFKPGPKGPDLMIDTEYGDTVGFEKVDAPHP